MLLIRPQVGLLTLLVGRERVENILKGLYVRFRSHEVLSVCLLTSAKTVLSVSSVGAAIVSISCPQLRASAVTLSLTEAVMGRDR